MSIRLYLPLLLTLCLGTRTSAQLEEIRSKIFGSADVELIGRATDSALVVVRVEYVLVDTVGDEYGTPESDYYGYGIYTGAVTPAGILLPFAANRPWDNDKGYEKSDTFSPRIYKVLARLNGQRRFDTLPAPVFDSLSPRLTLLHATHKIPSLPVNYAAVPGEAWLVTFSPKTPAVAGQDSLEYKVEIVRQTLTTSKDSSYFLLSKPVAATSLLGGVLITTAISTGKVQFQVLGLVNKESKDRVFRIPKQVPKQPAKQPTKRGKKETPTPDKPTKSPSNVNKSRIRSQRG